MNSFLISLGIVLVIALTAALVGPGYVDWNAYRQVAEAEAAKIVGRPVAITGDLDVSILPSPVIRAGGVEVAADDGGEPVAVVEAVELTLSLGALILGRAEITNLELVRPELRLSRMLAGGVELAGADSAPAWRARGGALQRIAASDARVVFDNPLGDGETTVREVDFTASAGSLSGPFRITGQYGHAVGDVERPTFTASVGNVSPGAPVKLVAQVAIPTLGDLLLDGDVVGIGAIPRFEGKVRLERVLPAASNGDGGRLAVEAIADAGRADADLREIRISAARGPHTLSIGGSGRFAWSARPEFSLDLEALQVDLDGMFGTGPGSGANGVAADLAEVATRINRLIAEHKASGRVRLAVGGALWRGELVRDISSTFEVRSDAIVVRSFGGRFPGETEIGLTGRLQLSGEPGFAGDLVMDSVEAGRFATWLAADDAAWLGDLFARTRGKLSMRGKAAIGPDRLALRQIAGFVDANPFTGTLALQAVEDRRSLAADLAFDFLNLDHYVPTDAGIGDLVDAATVEPGTGGGFPELDLDLTAKRFAFRGREAEGLRAEVRRVEGAIEIGRLDIEHFAGSSLAAHGRIEPAAGGAGGAVELAIESESVPRLLEALQLPIAGNRAFAALNLDVADVVLSVSSARTGDGHATSIGLAGDLAGVAVDATLDAAGPLAGIGDSPLRLQAAFEAEDGRRIFGPHGLIPLFRSDDPSEPARLSFAAEGRLSDGLAITTALTGYDARFDGSGRLSLDPFLLTGEASLAASDSGRFAAALGLGARSSLEGAETSLTATVTTNEGSVILESVEGLVAGGHVDASLAITPGDRPAVDLDVEADAASLPAIAAVLFGRPADADGGSGAAAPQRGAWPTELIDVGVLDAVALTAKGNFRSLAVTEGFTLAGAALEASLADGKLVLRRLEGKVGEGTVRAAGTASGTDHALAIDGRITLSDVPLASLLDDGAGRDLAGGRISLDASVATRGRSLLSLASSLAGSGTATIADASIPRFDADAVFDLGVIADSDAVMAATLLGGRDEQTALGATSGPVEAANGRVRIGPLKLETDALTGEATSFVDVATRRFDQEIVLAPAGVAGGIRLALIHAGAFGEIGREVEITNLPRIGTARWTEPGGALAEPGGPAGDRSEGPGDAPAATAGLEDPPAVEPPTAAVSIDAAGGGSGARVRPPAPAGPPAGLIEQKVIDLPILERTAPGKSDGGAG